MHAHYFPPSRQGDASYYDVHLEDGTVLNDVAWYYPKLISTRAQQLGFAGHVAFYGNRGIVVE